MDFSDRLDQAPTKTSTATYEPLGLGELLDTAKGDQLENTSIADVPYESILTVSATA